MMIKLTLVFVAFVAFALVGGTACLNGTIPEALRATTPEELGILKDLLPYN